MILCFKNTEMGEKIFMKVPILSFIAISFILGCKTSNTGFSEIEKFSGIVLWDYTSGFEYKDLQKTRLVNMSKYIKIYEMMPFDDITKYYWDEQVFIMPSTFYYEERDYETKSLKLFLKGDGGSMFFSLVVDGAIVLNGLSRLLYTGAMAHPYDDSKNIPRLVKWEEGELVFLRFVFVNFLADTVWHDAERFNQNVEILFNDEVYRYFERSGKLIRGRFDFFDIIDREVSVNLARSVN